MASKSAPKEVQSQSIQQKEGKRRKVFSLKLLLFALLLFVQLQFPDFFTRYGIPDNIIDALVFYVTAHMIISFSRLFLVFFYIRKSGKANEFKDNFILGVNQIANILSFVTLVLALFLLFKINARDFFTSISIVAAAIALLSKDYISNMINGMILMFSDQLSLEDYVKIGNHKGKIVNITLLNIHLLNDDDDLVYIPNNFVLASDIVNYTKRNIKKVTIEFELNEDHFSQFKLMEKEFQAVLKPYLKNVKEGSAILKVMSIHKDFVHLKFQFLLMKRNREIEKEIRRKVHEIILQHISEKETKVI